MRKLMTLLAVLASALAIGIVPAGAVTDGELDGDGHPYVGLMVAQDADGNPLWRCSGTLLSLDAVPDRRPLHRGAGGARRDLVRPGPDPVGAGHPAAGPDPCAGTRLPVHR